ncbi:MAG: hypothetical protein PUP93_34070 [Rhizonema sp. NSF051]|nr:hypothetical protein [Rhizonema sp. NSF051]
MKRTIESWKYGLAGALVISGAIAFSGGYASANTNKINTHSRQPDQSGEPPNQTSPLNLLQLKSLTSDMPVSNIYVRIKDTGNRSNTYTMNPGNPVPLNLSSCFNNTITVQLLKQMNSKTSRIIGEKTITISQSPHPLVFQGTDNGANYMMNYEIVPLRDNRCSSSNI